MLNRESGFIFPFSLFLLLLFTTITIYSIMKYETEKRFFSVTKSSYELELSLHFAYETINKEIQLEQEVKNKIIRLNNSTITYSIKNHSVDEWEVMIECITDNGATLKNQYIYHAGTKSISKWIMEY
ncbi:competence type IV pilus minor pilin ComGG [Bacillus kwashiorkori]|uniref:competence type IV pilus minor pilin ComGG n=1 Tax=Bacillus kwashiorkori TaxID=1522318 RepID=UPI00131A3E40|nr:competence type IV pilus minor pilin ComGG [Bacillus kwashiorkori]